MNTLIEVAAIQAELAHTKCALADALAALAIAEAAAEQARHLSLHDSVTGLANRTLFLQRLEHGLAQAKRHGWHLSLLFVDVDDLKLINDTNGHDSGDLALLLVSQQLQSAVRAEDCCSRWGGDEFAVVLLNVQDEAAVVALATRLRARIAATDTLDVPINISIGIAMFPQDGATAASLLKQADSAMYHAKASGAGVALASRVTRRTS